MITIGVDAHKQEHVALAIDEDGREIDYWQGVNLASGWKALRDWAIGLGKERQWGIEGAWSYGRGLAQHLVEAGERVYEINTRWTARTRRKARRRGKSDRLDARAIAAFARQEAPGLPRVEAEDETAVLDLLSAERESAVAEATRLRNQLHALLLQLDPGYKSTLANLKSQAGLAALEKYAAPDLRPIQVERAACVRRLAQRLRLALTQARELTARIRQLATASCAALTQICGVNLIAAATLAGILGPGKRYRSDAQLAAYAGVAPLEASSAGVVRHRLNRGGNRRLNATVYMIALSQLRHSPQAQAYVKRRISEGKSKKEAIRALKRFIIRSVWRAWQDCQCMREAIDQSAA